MTCFANQITGKECFQILNVLAIFNFAPKRCSPFSFFLLPYIYLKKYPKLLLKNTPNKHNKYVINQKLKHFDDISFREMFGRSRVFFFLLALKNKDT
jgi:hypothetical protein